MDSELRRLKRIFDQIRKLEAVCHILYEVLPPGAEPSNLQGYVVHMWARKEMSVDIYLTELQILYRHFADLSPGMQISFRLRDANFDLLGATKDSLETWHVFSLQELFDQHQSLLTELKIAIAMWKVWS